MVFDPCLTFRLVPAAGYRADGSALGGRGNCAAVGPAESAGRIHTVRGAAYGGAQVKTAAAGAQRFN